MKEIWMSVAFVVAILTFLSGCSVDTSASKHLASSPTPQTNSNEVNANNISFPAYETDKIDQAKQTELDSNNEKFKTVPDEFKDVDFANFRFRNFYGFEFEQGRYFTLKNGKFEYQEKRHLGGTTYSLGSVYYVDLAGDEKKEAMVFVYEVSCGGSCDGGATTIYFYSANKVKPELLDTIDIGSPAYGCSLKSFAIKDKTLHLEQFGRCDGSKNRDSKEYICKFCVKDLTKTVYYFRNSKLLKKSSEIEVTPETNVMNYFPEISINV